MDINAVSTQYLNSSYVPLSSPSMQAASDLGPGGESSFADLLRRAQNAKSVQNGSAAGNTGAAVSPAQQKDAIDKTDKLYGLCQDLETFLIKDLIKSMRDTVQKSDLIDSGFAGGMYKDMLYDEYAKTYSKNANFGFAEMAYRQLSGKE